MEIYRSSITELKSHQLNYLEIWSLGSNIPLGLHLVNGRKPSASETGGLYQAVRCCDTRTLVCVD